MKVSAYFVIAATCLLAGCVTPDPEQKAALEANKKAIGLAITQDYFPLAARVGEVCLDRAEGKDARADFLTQQGFRYLEFLGDANGYRKDFASGDQKATVEIVLRQSGCEIVLPPEIDLDLAAHRNLTVSAFTKRGYSVSAKTNTPSAGSALASAAMGAALGVNRNEGAFQTAVKGDVEVQFSAVLLQSRTGAFLREKILRRSPAQ
ncbi:hypothetical protein [Neogemmobacter tilapiae]|uniref:Lipoprotein n=1 Tax=Neogemmobacter tilapiae TaxID=875041 RepID=A0A918WHU2_9RHOB|nr:hypothetical protein [Gemmobacter tilapiae]GHC52901.1 hypothetical protein GCM10007315_14360 [Gemmobacter tilapiae]